MIDPPNQPVRKRSRPGQLSANALRASGPVRALRTLFCLGCLLLCFAAPADAQPVRVMTEFARFTPTGEIFPNDGIKRPVEVLSPPLVRGVWNAFRIVVDVEPGQYFRLFVAQNPDNALRVRLYREILEETDGEWRIARRQHVLLPFRFESLPRAERPPDRTTYTFWLEVQPPANFNPRRMKLEAQVLIDDEWYIYPMEVRIPDVTVSRQGMLRGEATTVDAGTPGQVPDRLYSLLVAKAMCQGPDRTFLSSMPSRGAGSAREHEAASVLARTMDAMAAEYGREEVDEIARDFLEIDDQQQWCAEPQFPRARFGPEWPTMLRNQVLRLAGDPD
jgi:hypothetical protein